MGNKNGTNIINFERDFRNLIRSTKFICYNIQKPFFLPSNYDNSDDQKNETPENKLNRIINEFDSNKNQDNVLILILLIMMVLKKKMDWIVEEKQIIIELL